MSKEKGVLTLNVKIKSLRMLLQMSLTCFTFKKCYVTVSLFFYVKVSSNCFCILYSVINVMFLLHSDALFSFNFLASKCLYRTPIIVLFLRVCLKIQVTCSCTNCAIVFPVICRGP
jgi:hypothetical protein